MDSAADERAFKNMCQQFRIRYLQGGREGGREGLRGGNSRSELGDRGVVFVLICSQCATAYNSNIR